jgi:phenylpyruvate tautomerase PptA (4-oxalocrotonate tautomerase family)
MPISRCAPSVKYRHGRWGTHIVRSPKAFIIDITLNAGRTVELKQQFYATLVERLNADADVRHQDVLVVLTEVAKKNWSFGNGEAQYV